MKIIRIIVDRIPRGCADCNLHTTQENVPTDYCAALKTDEYKAAISFDMYDYRRHDCPLDLGAKLT